MFDAYRNLYFVYVLYSTKLGFCDIIRVRHKYVRYVGGWAFVSVPDHDGCAAACRRLA